MSTHEGSPAEVPYDEPPTKTANPQLLSAEAIAPSAVSSSATVERSDRRGSQSSRKTMQQLLRKQLEKNNLEDNLKEIIKIWDFESGMTAQTPDVFESVEQVLDIDHATLSETWRRQEFIISMIRRALKDVLRTYGYVSFSWTTYQDKARLRIRPPPGQELPDLPNWLKMPFLEPQIVEQ